MAEKKSLDFEELERRKVKLSELRVESNKEFDKIIKRAKNAKHKVSSDISRAIQKTKDLMSSKLSADERTKKTTEKYKDYYSKKRSGGLKCKLCKETFANKHATHIHLGHKHKKEIEED